MVPSSSPAARATPRTARSPMAAFRFRANRRAASPTGSVEGWSGHSGQRMAGVARTSLHAISQPPNPRPSVYRDQLRPFGSLSFERINFH